jgi:SAM-dependent methyltransferase
MIACRLIPAQKENPMQRVVEPMHLYGQPEFDKQYLDWGLHSLEEQTEQAESALQILASDRPLRILDLACGIGIHAVNWAKRGHQVTAVDISEVFIAKATERAQAEQVFVTFLVGDIRQLPYVAQFDVVTWIESSFFDEDIVAAIRRYLVCGGTFLTDVRNPDHPRSISRGSNWRTWREKDGIFYLEKHETNGVTGIRDDVWIEIDPNNQTIRERQQSFRSYRLWERIDVLKRSSFADIGLLTMKAQSFAGGPEPYLLWLRAKASSDGTKLPSQQA